MTLGTRTLDELDIPPAARGSGEAHEILRAWVVDGAQHASLRRAFNDPGAWGLFLVDLARHAARAYAAEAVMSEAAAFARIVEVWDAQIDNRADEGTTEPLGDSH